MDDVCPQEIQRRAQAIGLSVPALCRRAKVPKGTKPRKNDSLSHTTFYRWLSGRRPLHEHYRAVIVALETAEAERASDCASEQPEPSKVPQLSGDVT